MVCAYVNVDSVREEIERLTCLSHCQYLAFELGVFFFHGTQPTVGLYEHTDQSSRLVYMNRLAVVGSEWHEDLREAHILQGESFHHWWNNITRRGVS